MVANPPETPVTTPPAVMEAMPAALLLHAPPPVASVNVIVPPVHTSAGTGAIAAGLGLTVTVAIT